MLGSTVCDLNGSKTRKKDEQTHEKSDSAKMTSGSPLPLCYCA